MAIASQVLLATATGGGVTGRLDAGRSSTGDADGENSPYTYWCGIYSTDEGRIGEEINFITCPLYILERNIFHGMRGLPFHLIGDCTLRRFPSRVGPAEYRRDEYIAPDRTRLRWRFLRTSSGRGKNACC
jgi:hypothetical protein